MPKPFDRLSAIAAPIMRANIDTDVIIRIERLVGNSIRGTLGKWAFGSLRYLPDGSENPAFILNREPYRQAEILVTGPNFGCGSSREGAVWSLQEMGIRAIIGATVEDDGFDKTVRPADIAHLRALAAKLFPPIAEAPELETWAGLRPSTPDSLPLLGPIPGQENQFLATGHYRNGILLAPATARVMAELIMGEPPSVDLAPFSPLRPRRPER